MSVRRVVLCAAIALAGCASRGSAASDDDAGDPFADGGAPIDPLTLDASVTTRTRLVLASCNATEGCHASGVAGLTFPLGDEARDLVNVPSSERPSMLRVAPGDPASSYLLFKLRDDGDAGTRMPPGSTYDPRLEALITSWIEAGAPRR